MYRKKKEITKKWICWTHGHSSVRNCVSDWLLKCKRQSLLTRGHCRYKVLKRETLKNCMSCIQDLDIWNKYEHKYQCTVVYKMLSCYCNFEFHQNAKASQEHLKNTTLLVHQKQQEDASRKKRNELPKQPSCPCAVCKAVLSLPC